MCSVIVIKSCLCNSGKNLSREFQPRISIHLFELNSPPIYREPTKNFPELHEKFCCGLFVRFSLKCLLFYISAIFREFSENFLTTFRRFYESFRLWLYNKALINQFFVLYGIYSVCTLKLRSEYFAICSSQLVSKSILVSHVRRHRILMAQDY